MLGLRAVFEYFECGSCGSIQIAVVPADLSRYYPETYYSFRKPSRIKRHLKCEWARFAYTKSGFLGRLLTKVLGENLPVASLQRLSVPKQARILDVGCGSGDLLMELGYLGFTNLRGVDPYNAADLSLDGGILIEKKNLSEMEETFDLVMLHHSFEHMADPRQVFKNAARILNKNGNFLVRVPVASSQAWKQYGADWVQLDAPRHLFIPSRKAMERLSHEFGFVLDQIIYDSTAFQFWGSEQYRMGISLSDKNSFQRNPLNFWLRRRKIKSFEERAVRLNESGQGDQACFYLKKKS